MTEPREKWEYCVVNIDATESARESLNQYGWLGWELIAISVGADSGLLAESMHVAYFKRRLPADAL